MKHSQLQILSAAALIPLLFLYSLSFHAQDKELGLKTVCIDAGHGGRDPGCISNDGSKNKEKDITLSIAQYLADNMKTAFPDVNVVMTRSDDTFFELGERAAIANRNNADLFISLHVNSVDTKKNKNWARAGGFSIHTLGQSKTGNDLFSFNMEVCKRENSVILLEDDYSTKYQGFDPSEPESYIFFNLMQNANLGHSLSFAEDVGAELAKGPIKHNRGISQDPFYVLWKTTMPAVLIEVGFITNASDLAIMKTENGRKEIADRILQAFANFKRKYDASLKIESPEPLPEASSSEETASKKGGKEEKEVFGTQIFASSKIIPENDKAFHGHKPIVIKEKKLYKYIIGISADAGEAKKIHGGLKEFYPEAFLVSVKEGKISRVR